MSSTAEDTRNRGKRSGTAIRAKGQKRVVAILEASRAILIEDGYTQFSLRNIAGRAGIHLSNLQYYFPGKDELIHGLMEFIADKYLQTYETLFKKLPDGPEARLNAAIEYLLTDIRNSKTRRFFVQLWALLESSDAHSGVLLNEMYALHISTLNSLIAEVSPHLSPGILQQRATMIASLIEGMMLMIEDADEKLQPGEAAIEDELKKQILRIAMDK
ncbi:MAG: TetR family transcriptional regulator [Gammaproteobacteria bacterium]|nr:TetR family transcriptional regulator [Gammaproteobacteria bacterium]